MNTLTSGERERRNKTRRRNQQTKETEMIVQWAEREAQLGALRRVRDNPDSTPADVVKAVELIQQIEANPPAWAWKIQNLMKREDMEVDRP